MIFTVLSAIGKGSITIVATFSLNYPFITLFDKSPSRSLRKVIESLNFFLESVKNLKLHLENCQVTHEQVTLSETIQNTIASTLNSSEHSMKEKLNALAIVNHNHEHIKKAPGLYEEMMKIHADVPEIFETVLTESKCSPFADILMQRGLQASSDGLKNPSRIVKKFWPII